MRKKLFAMMAVLLLAGCGTVTQTLPAGLRIQPVPAQAREAKAIDVPTNKSSPEYIAYKYLRDKLLPKYGRSSGSKFMPLKNGKGVKVPYSMQGIVSAVVKDFTGNGKPELVILRVDSWIYHLDCYQYSGGTYKYLSTTNLQENNEYMYVTPELSMQGNKLLLKEKWYTAKDSLTSGGGVSVFSITAKDGFKELVELHASGTVGKTPSYSVNHVDYDENTKKVWDNIDVCLAAQEALDKAGIKWKSMDPGEQLLGDVTFDVTFKYETVIFKADMNSEGYTSFIDYTDMYNIVTYMK